MRSFRNVILLLLVILTIMLTLSAWQTKDTESDSMVKEINNAVKKEMGNDFLWNESGTRYYGTYGDNVVFLMVTALPSQHTIEIDGYVFAHPTSFSLCSYVDGEIYELAEVYKNGMLTKAQLGEIFKRHIQAEMENDSSGENSQILSDTLRMELEIYYRAEDENFDENTIAGKKYYGTYNGYVILMDAGQLDNVTEMHIGGRVFKWGSSMSLYAYKDLVEYPIDTLYEAGAITDADLNQILENHKVYFAQEYNLDYDEIE